MGLRPVEERESERGMGAEMGEYPRDMIGPYAGNEGAKDAREGLGATEKEGRDDVADDVGVAERGLSRGVVREWA